MANANLTFTIVSALQQQGFTQASEYMKQLQSQLDSTKKESSLLGEGLSFIAELIPTIGLVEFFKKSVEAGAEAEQTQRRLQTAVESSGKSWKDYSGTINENIDSLSKNSRFSKEQLANALVELLTKTHDLTVSQNLLKTAMGISVDTGKDLLGVTDQLATAAFQNSFGLRSLSREFGISGTAAKNAQTVLDKLAETFDKDAQKVGDTTTAMSRFGNTVHEFFVQSGTEGKAATDKIINAGTNLIKNLFDIEDAHESLGDMIKRMDREEIAGAENKTKRVVGVNQQMQMQLVAFAENVRKETVKISGKTEDEKLQQVQSEAAFEKKELFKKYADQVGLEQDLANAVVAIDQRAAMKRVQIESDVFQQRLHLAVQFGALLGKATADSLQGQQDAWKNFLGNLIDMVASQVEAQILINGAQMYWDEAKKSGGYVGFITAAPILIKAAASAAAVAGLAQAAKGAIGSGGGSISGGNLSGGGAGSPAAASSPSNAPSSNASNTPEQKVYLTVTGSVIGDVHDLARRLSDVVQNKNVRLVASQVSAG